MGDINGDGITDCIDTNIDGDGVINTDERLWQAMLTFSRIKIFSITHEMVMYFSSDNLSLG